MKTLLERQLAASVAEVQAAKRDDIENWLDAAPVPPKRLKRKKMSEQTAIVVSPERADIAAAVVVHGDLSQLTEPQLKSYYLGLCESLGLNALSRPFSLLKLNGKELMYANRDCSDQLRKRDNVSIEIVSRDRADDMIVVRARATLPSGRVDESLGAVPCAASMKGEALANAMMKAETKAKRRVTLSICGLAFMDESEVSGAIASVASGGPGRVVDITPHAAPGEDSSGPQDDDVAADLTRRLETIKADCAACDSYDKALALRALIGTRANMTELTKRMQQAGESGEINPTTRKELGKLWMHCDRQVAKLEKQLAPGPEEIAHSDTNGSIEEDPL